MELSLLAEKLKNGGVAGAGGAGFPSYAKLSDKADTIVLNCAECEPLFKVHRQVLARYASEILTALDEVADAVGAEHIIIAVKGAYKNTIEAVEAVLPLHPLAQISLLPEVYPAGDEVVTVYETTGRVVPPGDIPLSVGVVVFNVETALNMYEAIRSDRPVTEKFVTVAGEVAHPSTYRVPLGMTARELIELAGGETAENCVILSGGPMTGRIVNSYDAVTKTTNAYLVLPERHPVIQKRTCKTSISLKRAMSACCQCRMCTDLCPRHQLGHPIEPHAFMRSASSGTTKDVGPFINTMFCSQCGVCEMYACFQGLSPRTLIGTYKNGLRANGVPVPKGIVPEPVQPARESRKIPVQRLTARLGLTMYDTPAPLVDGEMKAKQVRLLLQQHIGAPAQAVVKAGDKVKRGQLVGKAADGKLSLPVHAPIDGTVKEVNNQMVVISR